MLVSEEPFVLKTVDHDYSYICTKTLCLILQHLKDASMKYSKIKKQKFPADSSNS